jgi:hypothetical protein|tara:strand:- start:152 stop:415 length:264 start_codon:yes stop_codon:yes gene_type:complete
MKEINTGDLAYIPRDVTLVSIDRNGFVYKTTMTDKPILALVTKFDESKGYEVVYNGSQWYVNKRSIYPVNSNEYKEHKNASNFNGNT